MSNNGWQGKLAYLLTWVSLNILISSAAVGVVDYIIKSQRSDSRNNVVISTHTADVAQIKSQIKALQIEMTDQYKKLNEIESRYVSKDQDNFHMQIIREDERTMTSNIREDEVNNARTVQVIMTRILASEDKIKELQGQMEEVQRVTNQDNGVLLKS